MKPLKCTLLTLLAWLHFAPAGLLHAAKDSVAPTPEAKPSHPTDVQKALRQWVQKGGDLPALLEPCEEESLYSAADAGAVVLALKKAVTLPLKPQLEALELLLSLCQNVESRPSALTIGNHAVPLILEWAEGILTNEARLKQSGDNIMLGLKILALYEDELGFELLIAAARKGVAANSFYWGTIFDLFDDEHAQTGMLMESLSHPLPPPLIASALIGPANQAMFKDAVDRHPFESPEGAALLKKWLTENQDEEGNRAFDAAVAAAFLKGDYRRDLLALATTHSDANIRLEAYWAKVKSGDDSGLDQLAQCALDPNLSQTACEYLEELEHGDRIPQEAKDPDFKAKSEMIEWLKHPNEIGAPPESIELHDKRDLYWPPLKKTVTARLFRFSYRFPDDEPDSALKVAYGMTGGTATWSFIDDEENGKKIPAEELYLRHCTLEMNNTEGDELPEAEIKRLLAKYNAGMFQE